MNISLEDMDSVIRAMARLDVYCCLEDVPRITKAVEELGLAGDHTQVLQLTPHPAVDPGFVIVVRPAA